MGADNPLGPARFTGQGLGNCSLLLTREVLTGPLLHSLPKGRSGYLLDWALGDS